MEDPDAPAPQDDHTDADLARAIAAAPPGGALEAEAELYGRLAPRVRRFGLRHLRDVPSADDLAQQVLLMTIEALRAGRVRDPARLASYVLGVCRLVVQDRRRGESRRRRLLERYAEDAPAAEPGAEAPGGIDPARLRECLERLAARERSVVVMSFYGERSAEEVGEAMGLTPGNIRVIRHRAIARLRACLDGGEDRA